MNDAAQVATVAREYLRVSRDASGRARSVEEQHADHQKDAERNGWTLGEPYADVDVSASRYARQARGDFARLLDDLSAGRFAADALMLWESSRGSRRVGEWVELLELLEEQAVKVWVHTHGTLYDPANPRHRRTLLEDAVDSEYESAKTRDRVRRSVEATARAGRPHGRLLYGYTREYDERGRFVRQVPHPEQAPIVREIAERVAGGESCYEIARDLNRREVWRPSNNGSRTRTWDLNAIKRVAINPGYAGLRVLRGDVIGPAVWDAIIPPELWRTCVARLTDPRRKTVRDARLRHLLTGAVSCGVCGSLLGSQKNRGFLAYLCRNGFHVSIKQEWLDEVVEELVIARMSRPDAIELLRPPEVTEQAKQAKDELAELEARLEGFYREAAAGRITPAGVAAIEADLLPQIADAKRRSEPPPVPGVLAKLTGGDVRKRWKDMPIAQRRESVAVLLDIAVMPTRKGERTLNPDRIVWEWKTV